MVDFWQVRGVDPMVDDLPFVGSPVPMLGILGAYLIFVLKIGPKFMEKRKPFELTLIIRIYNIFQVIACTYIVHQFHKFGFSFRNTFQCVPNHHNLVEPKEIQQLILIRWFTWVIKAIDLMDTVFFVLRKKQRQVSVLHVYHHTSTYLFVWLYLKFSLGQMEVFLMVLNSYVHIVMYSYYFFSSYKNLDRILKIVKPFITAIQIAQLLGLLGQSFVALQPSCGATKLFYTIIPNIMALVYMFYTFYQKSYVKESVKSKTNGKLE